MPINATPDFFKAQRKYLEAKTREEKILALEEMLREAPSHKGAEVLRMQLKQKISKLRQQKKSKSSRKVLITKEGDAQVCILGLTQSGKSTLLSKLTNAKPEISKHPFTTVKPEIGTFDFEGVKIQMVEIPSSFKPVFMSIVQSSNGLVLVYKNLDDLKELRSILSNSRIDNLYIEVKQGEDTEKIKNDIWNMLGLIRIYCKEIGKKPEKKALVLRKGSTVEDAAKKIHKDFIKFFRFARVWGKSAKYEGQSFGLDHKLEDKDILEIHIG
jgi:ribosome-interacting GTPase 1